MARSIQIRPLEAPTGPTARSSRFFLVYGERPTSFREDRSEWPMFLSGGRLPKVGIRTRRRVRVRGGMGIWRRPRRMC